MATRYTLKTDGTDLKYEDGGEQTLASGIANVVEDTTPELGGILNTNGNVIKSTHVSGEPTIELSTHLFAYFGGFPTATSKGSKIELTAQTGGATSGGGGDVIIESGGSGASGDGGDIELNSGDGGWDISGGGGEVRITGGDALAGNSNGGDITLHPGEKTGTGTNGSVYLKQGSNPYGAILDMQSIATTNKTFTFPNTTGTFALAADIKSNGGLYGINVETLAANKTLTVGTDKMYQYLDEGGANRVITLDTASASAGDRWVIRHNGAYNDTNYFTIRQSTTTLDYIYAGSIKEFIFDGTNWISGENGSGEDDNKKNNLAIGYYSNGSNNGIAIGANADGHIYSVGVGYSAYGNSEGVAIGASSYGDSEGVAIGAYSYCDTYSSVVGTYAESDDYGIAIGNRAYGYSYSVAIGYYASSNSKRYSTAIGYYSETERYGELARNIDAETDQENSISHGGWSIETTDATATEMLAGGYTAQRYTIRASSCLAFTIHVAARDNTSGDCAAYKFEGAIKRDASSNTAVLATVTKTVIHEDDATWDCAVTADDTNESLKIEVTGDATNTVQWAATSVGVETHF